MIDQKKLSLSVLFLVAIIIVAALVYQARPGVATFPNQANNPPITTFTECESAGYPVMESYPRQCRTASGQYFVEKIENPREKPTPQNPTLPPKPVGACYTGGCSGEVCSDQENVSSACVFKPEFQCYKNAKCERQTNGQCGWTQSSALSQCLKENTTPPIVESVPQ